MQRNDVVRSVNLLRVGVGGALVVAPRLAGRIWVGDDAGGHGTRVFARALGARDLVLGATALRQVAVGDRAGAARLTQLGVLADGADLLATVIAGRNLSGPRRWLMPLIAAVVGGAGSAVWWLAEEVVEDAVEEDLDAALHPASAAGAIPVVDVGRVGIDEQRSSTLGDAPVSSSPGAR